MVGDINAHSPKWNSYSHKKLNATIFKEIIKQYGLLVNKQPGCATHSSSREMSIINHILLS